MPRGVRKEKAIEAEPSPAQIEQKDEVIQFDDGTYYRTVAGRKAKFNNDYPNGMIVSDLLTDPNNKDYFVFRTTIIPDCEDKQRFFIGFGQCERIPGNKFASLEKAESTAIGRALSHMSVSLLGASASDDEIDKASGKSNLQTGAREAIQEEVKTNPKSEPNYESLKKSDGEIALGWANIIQLAKDVSELKDIGNKIKEAAVSKQINEQLRLEFNKKLRALSAQKKE